MKSILQDYSGVWFTLHSGDITMITLGTNGIIQITNLECVI